MKFQMEITKPYCYVSWHFNSLALRLTPNPGQALGWQRVGVLTFFFNTATGEVIDGHSPW